MSSRPLEGLLVVSIEQAVAAPLCTVRLADAGARVIKIERPGGETARHYDGAVLGTSAYFTWLNRGKESVVLNLKAPEDFGLLTRLLERADVLVQNLAPGALDRLGLDPQTLDERYPSLIVLSIVGYGRDTDYASMRAYDLLVQAESGLCAITGSPDSPARTGVSVADIGTGMSAHAAVLEALIERDQTGQGQHIEIAMFDVMADWMSVPLLHAEYGGRETARHGVSHAAIHPYRAYRCADGELVVCAQTPSEWIKLCTQVLDRSDLPRRSEFLTNPDRVAHRVALDRELEPLFARFKIKDLITRLDKAGIAWGHLRDVSAVQNHPALRRTTVSLPDGAVAKVPRPPGRGKDFAPGPMPEAGEHTDAIRSEFA